MIIEVPNLGDKLKNCPFCDSVARNNEIFVRSLRDAPKLFEVQCICDARGPMALSPEMAIDLWNRRAPTDLPKEEE